MSPAKEVSGGKSLAGFLLSGFLFALLGAILPAWYRLGEYSIITFGNYFLSLSGGVMLSGYLAPRLREWRGLRFLLVCACTLACGALLALALAGPPVSPWFRMGGLFLVGTAMGLLNMGLFHAVSNSYTREPAVTVNLGGIFYGIGCMAAPMLVAGTFYIYTVGSILTLIAAVPAFFAGIYAKTPFPQTPRGKEPSIRQALQDFRSPAAVLFALLLFFQFGNEWSIAGWLPLFLIRRLGISSETSLFMLALYWMALLVGRLAAVAVLPRVRHGRLLLYSAAASLFGCVILLSTTNTFGAGTGVLMVGGGFAQVYPLVAEKIGRRFPYYHPGFFNGIFTFGVMGGLLAPASLGYLSAALDSIQVVMVLPFFGICMVCILLLLMWLESKLTQG